MASWNVGEDGARADFDDIIKDEVDEIEVEVEEEIEVGPESYQVEYVDVDEEEYLVEYKQPAPAVTTAQVVTVTGMWDENLDPLSVTFDGVVNGGRESAMDEDHAFHLADEHQLFQQVEEVAAEQPQQQRRPRRGGAAQRGRARTRGPRGQGPSGGSQWVRGDRLVEVNVNDDDVPEELREMVMNVVQAREAARVQATDRARRVRQEIEDEWMDADDGEVESFFAAEGTSGHFEWSPMGDYQGEREQFLPQQTGAVVASENAYGAFRQYWDDDIMSRIVTATNRYAAEVAGSSASFAQDWYDTNIHEVFVLFSFWMMLGIIRMPTIKSCFTTNPLLQTNVFNKMFSRSRYENLCRAFHLNDNSNRPTDSTNRLYSLGPILDHLNARFQETYIPSQNVCIDESLTLWKGNLSFRQYIKTKAAQYGVKTFGLCESSTGYLWSFFLYLGAGTSHDPGLPSTVLKSTTAVLRLIRPLLDKGYTLFMDNWFNSPLLARFLKTRKTDCVGTLRPNRSDVPPLMSLCNLKDGQFVARHSGDVVVLAFQDKNRKIATISTYHGDSQGQMEAKPYRPALYKPQVILDYNKSMGGVDRNDQMLEPYLLERKTGKKWTIKFFKQMLNCSILNARILLQNSTATPTEHIVFRLELVDQILRHHHQHLPRKPIPSRRPASSSLGVLRPPVQHFPRQTDEVTSSGVQRKRRRCTWCAQTKSQVKLRRSTAFVCSICDVPLCLTPCFEEYHAGKN